MPERDTASVAADLERLIRQAMQGRSQAQNDLWRAHRPWLAAVLLSHKPREMDIEDLMQDVAVKFVSKLHTLRDPASFRPWLRRIAINAAREAARSPNARRMRLNQPIEDDRMSQTQFTEPVEELGMRDEAEGLFAQAMTLPLEFREPLLLRCVQGLGSTQIAEILGLPKTTVETRLSRARRMLREEWMARQAAHRSSTTSAMNPSSSSEHLARSAPTWSPNLR